MNIKDFNKKYENQYRYVELEPYVRHNNQHVRSFQFQQFCPSNNEWAIDKLLNCHVNATSNDDTPVSDDLCLVHKQVEDRIKNPPKYILIVKDKHCDYFYAIKDMNMYGATALHLLKERKEEGYYYFSDEEKPEKPTHSEDDFDDPELKNTIRYQWNKYKERLRSWKEDKGQSELLDFAINKKNYNSAIRFLESRSDYEYEAVELTRLDEIE